MGCLRGQLGLARESQRNRPVAAAMQQRNLGKTMLSTLCGAVCAIALSNAVSVQADYQDEKWTIAAETR
jgi:hypothetical protein